MIEAPARTILDVIAEFLAGKPGDEELLAYYLPRELQARIAFLLELNGEDELTCSEAEELDDLARADEFMSLLKVNTRVKLRNISEWL